MSQVANLDTRGIKSFQSPYNESQAAMKDAVNVVIDKDNCIETRRGYDKRNAVISGNPTAIVDFDSTKLVFTDDKLYYDDSGTWTEINGYYDQDQTRVKTIQSKGNLYFTTDKGVYKLQNKLSDSIPAGVSRGLNGSASIVTSSGARGWFTPDTQIAYRVVWGYRDDNDNILLGSPSDRIELSNAYTTGQTWNRSLAVVTITGNPYGLTSNDYIKVTGSSDTSAVPNGDYQVTITAGNVVITGLNAGAAAGTLSYAPYAYASITSYIPNDVVVGYFYQIYRSQNSASSAFVANDELGLVYEGQVTSGQITAGYITYTDITPPSLIGETIYTAPSITPNGILDGNEPPPLCKDICEYKGSVIYAGTKTKYQAYLTLITTGGTVGIAINDVITIGGIAYTAKGTENVANAEFKVYTTGSISEDIRNTAISLVKIVNLHTLSTVSAYYISGYNDVPGKMQFIGSVDTQFTITCTDAPESFSPSLSTTLTSDNDSVPYRVYVSKYQEPEAVPILNYLDIGTAGASILRAIPLRDSIMVFMSNGEIYSITGEDFSSFNVRLFDNTALLLCPDSAVVTNNQIYCFTDQGLTAVSDNGVQIIGRDVEDIVRPLQTAALYPNFTTASYGEAYESERLYIFHTITSGDDTYCTQAFVLNYLTNSWTRWVYNSVIGAISLSDDKINYIDENGQFYEERKTRTNLDYGIEYDDRTISAVVGDYVTVTSSTNIEVGDGIQQINGGITTYDYITSIDGNNLYTSGIPTFVNGTCTIYKPIQAYVDWLPQYGGNPSNIKVWQEATFYFRELASNSFDVQYSSSYNQISDTVTCDRIDQYGWGEQTWGDVPWDGIFTGQQQVRTFIPYPHMKNVWLKIKLKMNNAFTKMSLYGCTILFEQLGTKER